jgi:hypothetical protein
VEYYDGNVFAKAKLIQDKSLSEKDKEKRTKTK